MSPPDPREVISDPRFKVGAQHLAGEVFRVLGPALDQMFQQAMAAMQQNLSPAGRVVEVRRKRGMQQTTSPQLLAELNDNMMDLIEELKRTNELAEEQLEEDAAPRRRRT